MVKDKYKEKCDAAARLVAAPVLSWLGEQNPDKTYEAYFNREALPDGPVLRYSNVFEIGPSILRKMLPKKIAQIGQFNIHTQDLLWSYDGSLLPLEKLEDLMSKVNILDVWRDNLPSHPKSIYDKVLDWLEDPGKKYEG